MKKLLFIFLLLAPIAAFCGDKKKQKIITPGRWRETTRMLPDSTKIQYRDTLYISFQPKDSFQYHYRNGFIYEGIFKISEDSLLDFGTERFKVVYLLNVAKKVPQMVLTNPKGIFYFSVDSSPVEQAIVIEKEDTATPVTNIDVMIGRWTVYKRKSAGMGHIDATDNIRSVYITGASTDGKLGYVYSGADPDSQPSWYIKDFSADQSLICDGKNLRNLVVKRCQKGEMVIEDDGITFYLKQLK